MDEIYIPMTANLITVGHIKILEKLSRRGWVTVGLLTPSALKGYKKEIMPFEDRKYILETIGMAIGHIEVVPQESLDPTENIKKYKCTALASGDGFLPEEERCIKKLGIKKLEVNSGHKTHSSDLI